MRGPLFLNRNKILLLIFCAVAELPALAPAAESQGRIAGSASKIRLGTPVASLSYLPIYVALKKGFFARL
jgi:ABC-type nitrate/sulfonate/bicarbonate transport system substrate-binding protein